MFFQKISRPLSVGLLMMACVTCGLVEESEAQLPPAWLRNQYEAKRNFAISDDFNSLNKSKWVTRRSKPGFNIKGYNNQIQGTGNKYLSLLAKSVPDQAGVSALNQHGYGFTVCRWRIRGIGTTVSHKGHPAIWAWANNLGQVNRQISSPSGRASEIDWMEYSNGAKSYHARIIPGTTKAGAILPQSVFMFTGRKNIGGWKTQGFEHTPNRVLVWELQNGQWKKVGKQATYTGATSNAKKTINRAYRARHYFILSNVWFNNPKFKGNATRLDIDFLHHYRRK